VTDRLSAEEIEARAQEVLDAVPDWLWEGSQPPVPIDDIADTCFGLNVCATDDLLSVPGAPAVEGDQTLSGLLIPWRGQIWVNADEARQWPGRRRFTIGHELGHYVLHAARGEPVFCRHSSVVEGDDGPALGPPPAEDEANRFAAALLMPAELIRRYYRRDLDFHALCARFGASGAAMGRRLHAVI
jgi:hypothetical protein